MGSLDARSLCASIISHTQGEYQARHTCTHRAAQVVQIDARGPDPHPSLLQCGFRKWLLAVTLGWEHVAGRMPLLYLDLGEHRRRKIDLVREWRGVKVPGHAQEVLDFVTSL